MSIKIDVPGVGRIDVDGAAEERTMREILAAVQARNKQEGVDTKEVNEALKDLGKNAKDAADDIKDLGKSADSLSKGFGNFGKTLTATAANIAVSFVKAYDTMAEKPIQAGAALMQATIDLSAQMLKLGIDTLAKAGKGAAAILGPWAGGVQATADAVAKFGKDIVDLGEQVATVGNAFLAAEFEKRITALSEFTKAGASFAGGMTEIGNLANESGIGLANYSKAVANSRDAITAMGIGAGEAAKLVAKGYKGLTETTGKSGKALREELLALGYSYEEQGEVMSLFMAQQRRAGRNLENLAPDELARGTAEYAKNLKVISDITGQDAKKIMERAQVESMRGALAGKLTKQQNDAFQGAFAGLAKIGPEMAPKLQLALTQLLSGRAVRDPAIAGNKYIMDMLKQTVQMVNAGALNTEQAFAKTTDNLVVTGDQINSTGQDMKDVAAAFGVTGTVAEMANMENAFRSLRGRVGEADKSFKGATGQAEATDKLTTGYQDATKSLTDFQNKMENLATEALPKYAEVIGANTERAAKVMGIAIDYLTGKIQNLTDLGYALYNEGKPPTYTGTYKPPPGAKPTDLSGLPGDKRTVAEKLKQDAEVAAGKKAYNAFAFDQPNIDPYEVAAAKAKQAEKTKKLEDLTREELRVRHEAVQAEMLKIVTAKETTKEEREAHNIRIKELNKEAALIVERQRAKGWVEPNKPATGRPAPGKAKGGISEGPISGYSETLHGREAVVPLPDNRGIPVQLDTGSLGKQLAQQAGILSDILTALQTGNRNTSGILQQGY